MLGTAALRVLSTLTMVLSLGLAGPACDSGPSAPSRLASGLQLGGQRSSLDPVKAAEQGHAVFRTKCSACHGADAKGRVGIGPRLASKSFLEAATDRMLTKTIEEGRAGTTMVPWGSTLTDEEIEHVVAYLRSTVPHSAATLDQSPLWGDANNGGKLFRSICVRCHGRSGAGYMESAAGTGIGRQAFLVSVSDGYLRHVIKQGKSLTPMRGFEGTDPSALANLGKTEIDDIITYLRQQAW
jgi:cbb3-type cytochrome c oxidase subunit III